MSGACIEYDVPVEMADGTVLRADVYRPAGDGPWPVIVARTPYDKSDPYVNMLLDPLLAVRHGLIAVIQDVRGRFASEGTGFVPFASEAQDGADTVAWAARMEGSTGRVGMWGPSYLGNVQWQAAAQRPPALAAIAPSITFRSADGLTTRGGARELGLCRPWSVYAGFDALMRRHADDAEVAERALGELIAAADGLPGPTYDELPTGTRAEADPVVARLRLPTFDVDAADVSRHQLSVEVPVLNIGGWFDVFLQGTIDNFVHGGPEDRLVIGPWNHMSSSPQQGELNFGCAGNGAAVDLGPSLGSLTFDWLRAHLLDEPTEDECRVKIFTMGANQWRSEPSWPPERAKETRFFLVASGLSDEVPSGQSGTRSFMYDPADPVRTLGGCTLLEHPPAGTFNQSAMECRDDVLVFTTGPLSEAVEVTGRVTARIRVSTDAPTTDWVVRLCDVHPDGDSYNVCDGITRVTSAPDEPHRRSGPLVHEHAVQQGPSPPDRCDLQLVPPLGPQLEHHRGFETGEMRVAKQTVHLGSGSYISLPVVPVTTDV